MKYEKITDDGNLWSVIYEGKELLTNGVVDADGFADYLQNK